jgi:8-oxo-dGTP diphosphatase
MVLCPCYHVPMEQKADIHKAAGVIINNRKLLVSREVGKDFFVAPGGKLDAGETAEQALVRELYEEENIVVKPEDLKLLDTFYAVAKGKEDAQTMLRMDVYMVGEYEGEITPSGDIEEDRWIDSTTTDIELGSIFAHDVIPRLKADGLID